MTETRNVRILYMEDDPSLARLLQKHLNRRGYDVAVAGNGEEGLALVEQNGYDLILVDYHMPGCGGIEVIRTLTERGRNIPTIMVTGNGNEKVAVEALKLGATDYIVKDVDMSYLELLPMVIEQVMAKQQLVKEKELMIKAVQDSEERYRKLVELSPDGIAIHVDKKFVFVNEAASRMLGASAAELIGKPASEIVHPDYFEIVEQRLDQMKKNIHKVPWIEEKLVRRDGSHIDVEIAGVPYFYQDKSALQVILRDISERKMAEKRLEYLAHYDTLTGLPNRMLFFDRLNQAQVQARRYEHLFGLLFLDLDRFKNINDTLGHDAGDALLKEVATRLGECLRKSDSIARMGGDEFTVILSKITEAGDSAIVAKKIIEKLAKPFVLSGQECSIGVSIGIALFPTDGEDTETLLKKADIAMYRAKEKGRNTYEFYNETAAG